MLQALRSSSEAALLRPSAPPEVPPTSRGEDHQQVLPACLDLGEITSLLAWRSGLAVSSSIIDVWGKAVWSLHVLQVIHGSKSWRRDLRATVCGGSQRFGAAILLCMWGNIYIGRKRGLKWVKVASTSQIYSAYKRNNWANEYKKKIQNRRRIVFFFLPTHFSTPLFQLGK